MLGEVRKIRFWSFVKPGTRDMVTPCTGTCCVYGQIELPDGEHPGSTKVVDTALDDERLLRIVTGAVIALEGPAHGDYAKFLGLNGLTPADAIRMLKSPASEASLQPASSSTVKAGSGAAKLVVVNEPVKGLMRKSKPNAPASDGDGLDANYAKFKKGVAKLKARRASALTNLLDNSPSVSGDSAAPELVKKPAGKAKIPWWNPKGWFGGGKKAKKAKPSTNVALTEIPEPAPKIKKPPRTTALKDLEAAKPAPKAAPPATTKGVGFGKKPPTANAPTPPKK